MVAGGVWEWVRPEQLVTTQCSGWPCTYDTVLDFVFAGGPARDWPSRSAIAVVRGDFPDDTLRSDHRAVLAEFAPGGEEELAGEVVTLPQTMPPAAGVTVAAPRAATAPAAETAATATPPAPGPTGATSTADANLRAGPGTQYAVVGGTTGGQALLGDLAPVGISADDQWIALANGAWIYAELVRGAPPGLAVSAAPPAAVTDSAPVAPPDTAASPPEPQPTPAPSAPAGDGNPWPEYTCEDNPVPPPNPACPIKGNITGEHIYHMPGQRDYCETVIDESRGERWFCSPEEAEAAGWRAAKR
jgi:hypothetical protein